MKELINDLKLKQFTFKQKMTIVYFVLSLCFLCVGDETPIWVLIILLLNFGNATRLIKKVPVPEID